MDSFGLVILYIIYRIAIIFAIIYGIRSLKKQIREFKEDYDQNNMDMTRKINEIRRMLDKE